MPAVNLTTQFAAAFERAVLDSGLEAYMTSYGLEWFSPPTQPHASVLKIGIGGLPMRRAGANHPFPFTLPPEDVARLAAGQARAD